MSVELVDVEALFLLAEVSVELLFVVNTLLPLHADMHSAAALLTTHARKFFNVLLIIFNCLQ